MNDFVFQAPTKVVFGKGVENQVGQLCKEQGATKVLVHFGGQSAKKSGLLDRVYASLDAAGHPLRVFGRGEAPIPGSLWCTRALNCASGRAWTSCCLWAAAA